MNRYPDIERTDDERTAQRLEDEARDFQRDTDPDAAISPTVRHRTRTAHVAQSPQTKTLTATRDVCECGNPVVPPYTRRCVACIDKQIAWENQHRERRGWDTE